MEWITGIQSAINYIEDHITEELDYEEIAKESFSSPFHFQRVFSILCGYTLGEYIRNRRLTLAGAELANTQEKVIDVAYKYGYDNPESFAKAFQKFHGIPPSQARGRGVMLKSFSRLSIKVSLEGGSVMNYRIEEKPAMVLTGYKRHFTGSPNDKQDQDHNFACETRLEQYILEGMCREHETVYQVLTNFDPEGYDFYFAYQFPQWALEDMDELPPDITARFENVPVPAGCYLVCETERCQFPTTKMDTLRKKAIGEWLPTSGYALREAPEIGVIHWFWEEGNDKRNNSRYCELWLPIAKK
ncbi:MAG TPA: AraC family transcriptional regulator [Candidatus Faecousia excrementigallinarum]|uniref:AraC family transcriptional regulator n=1 Tax=Candidatus Faecousia excrementigallinarum TaxID=2840806 RepID=A0A9D0Z3R0_9FIRM|nr:AraC family transcriptional regulator [Candidatus Faecousia excrementigallinarum]